MTINPFVARMNGWVAEIDAARGFAPKSSPLPASAPEPPKKEQRTMSDKYELPSKTLGDDGKPINHFQTSPLDQRVANLRVQAAKDSGGSQAPAQTPAPEAASKPPNYERLSAN
jgi:hypothetical protein